MKKNMGNTDKMIRIVLALVIVGLYVAKIITGTLGTIGLGVAAIFIITSLLNFCPLYTLIGIKTCKTIK